MPAGQPGDPGSHVPVFQAGGHRWPPARLAADVAAWRSWYRRSVVLDALEYLHQHRPAGRP
ncbi:MULTISPECIES: hypothetical protein [unclassified Streptomyces]|uniref:hypothetical protein n=1 Tax=unclassified Streptomyces TaxID=2593676 RepID=UPI00093CFB50